MIVEAMRKFAVGLFARSEWLRARPANATTKRPEIPATRAHLFTKDDSYCGAPRCYATVKDPRGWTLPCPASSEQVAQATTADYRSPRYVRNLRQSLKEQAHLEEIEAILDRWNDSIEECVRRGAVLPDQIVQIARTYSALETLDRQQLAGA